jgi:hypothetical protein
MKTYQKKRNLLIGIVCLLCLSAQMGAVDGYPLVVLFVSGYRDSKVEVTIGKEKYGGRYTTRPESPIAASLKKTFHEPVIEITIIVDGSEKKLQNLDLRQGKFLLVDYVRDSKQIQWVQRTKRPEFLITDP